MVRPRALFDTNLYINLLLSRNEDGTAVGFALRAASRQAFELLLPDDVVAELGAVVVRRAYLKGRISREKVDELLERLLEFATRVPSLEEDPPRMSRDPHNDFLLSIAVLHEADFIVTRGKDLLALGNIANVQIVDPVTFVTILRSTPG